jgi:hypothetical protein
MTENSNDDDVRFRGEQIVPDSITPKYESTR